MRNCRKCLKDRVWEKLPTKITGRWKGTDERGRQWKGHLCPDCANTQAREYNHRTGRHKPIDKTDSPRFRKARNAELVVAEFFKGLGLNVSITSFHGPDVIVNDKVFIEVKSAINNRNGSGFSAGKVSPNRKKDHYVAVVKEGLIIFDSMECHLQQCNKSGTRNFGSKLLKE